MFSVVSSRFHAAHVTSRIYKFLESFDIAKQIDDAAFASSLLTNSVPDPDLVIRTSGEQRVSNFLLWQIAYSEFVFMDVLWPDFGENELRQAITEYQSRERRYGASEKPT